MNGGVKEFALSAKARGNVALHTGNTDLSISPSKTGRDLQSTLKLALAPLPPSIAKNAMDFFTSKSAPTIQIAYF